VIYVHEMLGDVAGDAHPGVPYVQLTVIVGRDAPGAPKNNPTLV